MTISALEALDRLREGNQRFLSDVRTDDLVTSQTRRSELVAAQEPFAVILGCADSRVPSEMVFDQGLGDLFVIRVAGNIVAPPLLGSVEFAATRFGTRLVVVLGHSHCGAIEATIGEIRNPSEKLSPNLCSIVNRVRPSIKDLVEDCPEDSDELVSRAVRANIRTSVQELGLRSSTLGGLIQTEGLLIVGAEYALETGVVEFFEGVPEGA
ncbi:MAG: carbonic anhydrase [Acidobacteriota bacterium]